MKTSIAYLLMQMPAPSEVFLAVEINGLIRAGVGVKVFCLRPPHSLHRQLVVDQELSEVEINFFHWFSFADIIYWLNRKPGAFHHMLRLLVKSCWRQPATLLKSLLLLPKSFSIARRIEQDGFRIIHAAWGHYPAITAYLAKLLIPDLHYTLALGAYDRIMQHPMTPVAADRAACILTQSEASGELLRNQWPRSSRTVQVIPRGVDLAGISSSCGNSQKLPGLIASVGRLLEIKGHQYVIEAFAQVHRQIPDSRLVIFGEGSYRENLERLVNSLGLTQSVELAGHLSHAALFRRIAESSLFVLASRSPADNLPNSVKEAMAIGIPVVTTPTTGISALIEDGVTGCIVPMRDVDALADALVLLLKDRERAEDLAESASRRVRETFDIGRTTEMRARLYRSIIERNGVDSLSSASIVPST